MAEVASPDLTAARSAAGHRKGPQGRDACSGRQPAGPGRGRVDRACV